MAGKYFLEKCVFCENSATKEAPSNNLAYSRYNKYPVSPGHLLIVPRHAADYFEATS